MKSFLLTFISLTLLWGCSKEQPDGTNNNSSPALKSVTLPTIPSGTFTITSYGAVSSSTVDNTSAIQSTIDACSAAGGGTVVVPSGTFLCGPINMKNKINLQLASGAILRVLPYGTYPNSGSTSSISNFISGTGLSNIMVSGSGTIDGQGSAWWTAYKANSSIKRPCLIRFNACSYMEITGVKFQNAPNVHITIGTGSTSTTISNITINSPSTSPNTDGIDIWSDNVNVTNCNISCGDDNIAMDNNSKYITITGCTFGVGHGCSIGSYAANVDHINVDNCTFNGTTSGIRMKSNRDRGGVEQYLTYSNITMTNVTNPIYITSYYPSAPSSASSDPAQAVTATTPNWKHITLQNITITGSANAGILWGLPELSISDITFDNVKISASKGMVANFVSGAVFKNGSTITASSGNAITTYNASITGINLTTGKPQ